MKQEIKLNGTIEIMGVEGEVWVIEQEGKKFFITSTKGYNGFEGDGHMSLVSAINNVNKQIKNYYYDRCL